MSLDSPEFIKRSQIELLYTLFDSNNSEDILGRTLENPLFCVTKTIDKVMTGDVDNHELVISKQLGMNITKYRYIFPHIAAAIQSTKENDKAPVKGKTIQYIYTDSEYQNPLNRIVTADGSLENIEYDKERNKGYDK